MKLRIISVILALALLFALPGCDILQPGETTPQISATSGSSYDGVSVTLSAVNRTATDTTLRINWKNETEHGVMYGEVFGLQQLKDGQWVDCQTKPDTAFFTVGYVLNSGESLTRGYSLAWRYGNPEPGTYRFNTSCHVYDTAEGTACNLWVEFTLGSIPEETVPDNSNQASTYKEPPKLILNIGTETHTVNTSGYQWNYSTGNGNFANTVADVFHPLQGKDTLSVIDTTQQTVTLSFADMPDSVTVRCWPDSQWDNTDAESEEISVENFNFALKPAIDGGYIYEVIATWNSEGSLHHGVAHYYFYIASYPVTPIQPRN